MISVARSGWCMGADRETGQTQGSIVFQGGVYIAACWDPDASIRIQGECAAVIRNFHYRMAA